MLDIFLYLVAFEILATPPQQLVLTTTEHAHTNAASAILCQVHMQLTGDFLIVYLAYTII